MLCVLITHLSFKLSLVFLQGFPISGFQVDAVDQVVLNLQDEVQQTWKPGDHIVVASTDYSMHQAEEFILLPCTHCNSKQIRIQGKKEDRAMCACVSLQLMHIAERREKQVFNQQSDDIFVLTTTNSCLRVKAGLGLAFRYVA